MAVDVPWKTPSGGLWPLGRITVVTPGSPVPVNSNVGPQTEQGLLATRRIRAFIFSNALTSTVGKNLYLVKHGFNKSNTDSIFAVLPAGTGSQIGPAPIGIPPQSFLENSRINIDNFDIDADEAGASIQVTGIYE